MVWNIIILGIIMTAGSIFVFVRHYHVDIDQARTGVFLLLVFLELVRVQLIRAGFGGKLTDNKWLVGAILLSVALVLLVVFSPLSLVFKTAVPSLTIWIEIGMVL